MKRPDLPTPEQWDRIKRLNVILKLYFGNRYHATHFSSERSKDTPFRLYDHESISSDYAHTPKCYATIEGLETAVNRLTHKS